jgi:prepilin signal peptidase PulO-like enzyme (type II secretory pathway)
MVLMIIAVLFVVGLCLGSFVNALVWRIHQQAKQEGAERDKKLSLLRGRSICPNCGHQLAAKDLVPVLSWLSLRGKCRYCNQPIAAQYPLVEFGTAALFVISYIWWPAITDSPQTAIFILWLLLLTGLMALLVYDARWLLLPNRILYPLAGIAGTQAVILIASANKPLVALLNMLLAVIIGGGLFYLLFQFSDGKWIGGGDVKLGWLLGMIAATPARSLLFIFIASVLGSLVSIPLLASKRLSRTSIIPFGPFLIAGLIIVQLFGADILHWYSQIFIGS